MCLILDIFDEIDVLEIGNCAYFSPSVENNSPDETLFAIDDDSHRVLRELFISDEAWLLCIQC